MKFSQRYMIIFYGPTSVGKSYIAESLAQKLPISIVNLDMGQCYTPLSIGTAKPEWHLSAIPHYLFDIIDEPKNFSAYAYRKALLLVLEEIWLQQRIPLIVGGSGFYLKSIFYPPQEIDVTHATYEKEMAMVQHPGELWEKIRLIDPERAAKIHPNDLYRLQRAYTLFKETGKKPSSMQPTFCPPAQYSLICFMRDRQELYARINERVYQMIERGWVKEVANLCNSEWELFLFKKKIIGYGELIDYLKNENQSLEETIKIIQHKTRQYAKRQITFWKMLKRDIEQHDSINTCIEANLTLTPVDLYISQLTEMILKRYNEK